MYFKEYKKYKSATIRESLFWEFNRDEVDMYLMKSTIIQRVIERGRINDFYAILNIYGPKEVKKTITELSYLSDRDIAFVCAIFQLKKTDLKCYLKKQSAVTHWNS